MAGGDLYWSDEIYRIFGLKPQEFGATYEAFIETVHVEDRENVRLFTEDALVADTPYSIDHRIIRPDGEIRWVHEEANVSRDDDGVAIRMVGTVHDITDLKRAEKAVLDERDMAKSYLDVAGEIIVAIDSNEIVTLINREGCDLLGRHESEIVGSNWFDNFLPSSNHEAVRERFAQLMMGGPRKLERYRNEIRTASGELRFISWHNSLLTDGAGRVTGTISAGIDITEQIRAEGIARKHQDELAHVSRISTMGQMATGIAHELNQPLTGIAAYSYAAKMIVEGIDASPRELKEILGKLEAQAVRAGDIVRRLRGFLKKNQGPRELTDLNSLVRDVAGFVEPNIRESKVTLSLQVAEDTSASVLVDEIQIQQVLVNLVRNAIDAMDEIPPERRKVTVVVRVLQDGSVEVTVRDVGKGIV
ncbi:MAG: PAS domain S-box protein, partial [Fuerstiella sp.]